jgi:hypothetical protein
MKVSWLPQTISWFNPFGHTHVAMCLVDNCVQSMGGGLIMLMIMMMMMEK